MVHAHPLQVLPHFLHGRVAALGSALHGLRHDGIESPIGPGAPGRQVELAPRNFTAQSLVQHHADRVNIRPMIACLSVELLRRNVVPGAENVSRRLPYRIRAWDLPLCDAEVRQLRLPFHVNQYIRRLYVPVHHPLLVTAGQALADFADDPVSLCGCQFPLGRASPGD